jgi:hypothetical protein
MGQKLDKRKGINMNIEIGKMQDISIHDVSSVELDQVSQSSLSYMRDKYFTTLTVKTKEGQTIDISLWSEHKNILNKISK